MTARLDRARRHKRPGYRCRDGYTSTRERAHDRPKALYTREDHLFARLWTIGLQPDHHLDWLVDIDQHQVAALLRHHSMIIVCGMRSGLLVTPTGIVAL